MLLFTLKRIILSIPTLFLILTVTFFMMKAIPGGPFDEEKALPPEVREAINRKYGFDKPVYEQYLLYLKNVVTGDLGSSYRYGDDRQIIQVIKETLPISFVLGFLSLTFALIIGILIGVVCAIFQDGPIDHFISFLCAAGISLPNFLLATLLVLVFSIGLNLFPPALLEDWKSFVLPIITLTVRPLAMVARLIRSSMIEVLAEDYIRTAIAKGLRSFSIYYKHALRNSLVPLISIIGPMAATIITGSFVVELIFAIPGMGRHFVSAVLDRDYALVMGLTISYGIILILSNLVADLFYGWIDPRVRDKV